MKASPVTTVQAAATVIYRGTLPSGKVGEIRRPYKTWHQARRGALALIRKGVSDITIIGKGVNL